MYKLMKKPLVFLVATLTALMVYAADLDSAKRAGQVGEQSDGYVGLVDKSAPADVKAMVDDVNSKRKAAYADIAKKNKVSLDDVARLTGKKQIDKTASGQYVNIGGQWRKK